MMAAMMLPSAAPMVAVHAAVERRRRDLERSSWGGSAAFVGGYLVVWTAFGVVAYAIVGLVGSLDVDPLSWSRGERYVAVGVIAVAAVYQLTPLKDACLAKCRARSHSSSDRGESAGSAPLVRAWSTAPDAWAAAGR
jgi:predicted metal-binding membrane protein